MSPLFTWVCGGLIGTAIGACLVVLLAYLIPQDRRRSSR